MYSFELFDQKLTFVFQPIVEVDAQGKRVNTIAHEILLRDAETDCFPLNFFQEQLQSNEKILPLYTCYAEGITQYFKENPTHHLNVNINPNQFFLQATYEHFKKLELFSDQITFELTESPYVEGMSSIDYIADLLSVITHIKEMGFHVALDDVGTGENTLQLAEKLSTEIEVLKFTTVPFHIRRANQGNHLLRSWRVFANKKRLPLIIEGIETSEQAQVFAELGYTLQQGYYWNEQEQLSNWS